eukprot:631854-Amphidinium_carterae.1
MSKLHTALIRSTFVALDSTTFAETLTSATESDKLKSKDTLFNEQLIKMFGTSHLTKVEVRNRQARLESHK